jgi:hypothetical protein
MTRYRGVRRGGTLNTFIQGRKWHGLEKINLNGKKHTTIYQGNNVSNIGKRIPINNFKRISSRKRKGRSTQPSKQPKNNKYNKYT